MTTVAETVSKPRRLVKATTWLCSSSRLRTPSTDVNPLSSMSCQLQLACARQRDLQLTTLTTLTVCKRAGPRHTGATDCFKKEFAINMTTTTMTPAWIV